MSNTTKGTAPAPYAFNFRQLIEAAKIGQIVLQAREGEQLLCLLDFRPNGEAIMRPVARMLTAEELISVKYRA